VDDEKMELIGEKNSSVSCLYERFNKKKLWK
jgi:hypothetical protein